MQSDPFFLWACLRERSPFLSALRLPKPSLNAFLCLGIWSFLTALDSATRLSGNGWGNLALRGLALLLVLLTSILTVGVATGWVRVLLSGSLIRVDDPRPAALRALMIRRTINELPFVLFTASGALLVAGHSSALTARAATLTWSAYVWTGLLLAVWSGFRMHRQGRQSPARP